MTTNTELEAFKAGYWMAKQSDPKYMINPIYPEKSLKHFFDKWKDEGHDFWPDSPL